MSLVLALHEALRLVREEWLPTRWERHRRAHEALRDALAVLGLDRLAPDGEELRTALAVRVPEGVDESAVRGRLRSVHGIEITPGAGALDRAGLGRRRHGRDRRAPRRRSAS